MARKIKAILCIGILLVVLGVAPALAGDLHLGLEWQDDDGAELAAVKLEYSLNDYWRIRGIYDWDDEAFSPGVIYRMKPKRMFTSYLGVGLRDVNDGAGLDVSLGKKTELILGLEFNVAKVSAAVEARTLPADWFADDDDETGYDTEIGFSINIGFSPSRLPWRRDADLYLLAQIITVEAGDEPYLGQVAVGAVVMNRVASPKFPDSIRAVVTQPNQFHSWPKAKYVEPTESCLRAAKEAMAGVDPTHGALFFYNPDKASPEGRRYFEQANLKVTVKIGLWAIRQ